MLDNSIIWAQAHPIGFVTLLCLVAGLVAWGSLPRVHDWFRNDHPRY